MVYVTGVIDGVQHYDKTRWCFPDGTSGEIVGEVVCQYVRNNPQKLHKGGFLLTPEAFDQSYKCRNER
jgi:hypothetical protein